MKSVLLICVSSTLIGIASFFDSTVRTMLSAIVAVIATITLILTIRKTRNDVQEDKED